MLRSNSNSTIISYHAGSEYRVTTAQALHRRLSAAGRSVYWNHIFANNDDPTFVFLVLLWYALYAWDETFEALYAHICSLVQTFLDFVKHVLIYKQESRVIHTNNIYLTQELHVIQAHLFHYASLLEEFRKTVLFVLDTPNPALEDPTRYTLEARLRSEQLMQHECKNLLGEIHRLEKSRSMQSMRLQNVMNLVHAILRIRAHNFAYLSFQGFNYVNLEDSKHMARLREASLKDSAGNMCLQTLIYRLCSSAVQL
jgi:hypothetical protein